MTALAYPFFRDTVEIVGRLLALQDDFTAVQVQGRIVTIWGDRTTSKLAARKLAQHVGRLGSTSPGKNQGHFSLARKLPPEAHPSFSSGYLRPYSPRADPTKSKRNSCCDCRNHSRSRSTLESPISAGTRASTSTGRAWTWTWSLNAK